MKKTIYTIVLLVVSLYFTSYSITLHIDTVRGGDTRVETGETLFVSGGSGWGGSSVSTCEVRVYKGGSYVKTNTIAGGDRSFTVASDSVHGYIYDVGDIGFGDANDAVRVRIVDNGSNEDSTATQNTDDVTPNVPILFSITTETADSTLVDFSWNGAYDDGSSGTASSCTIKYSSSAIDDETKWGTATTIPCTYPSLVSGANKIEDCDMSSIAIGDYFYALKCADNMGNLSPRKEPAGSNRHKPVTLSSFTASWSEKAVVLKWRTQSEVDNLKWIIQRSTEEYSGYKEVHSRLTGRTSSIFPTNYEFRDGNVETGNNYYYLLIDVSLQGEETVHGPISTDGGGIFGGERIIAQDRILLDEMAPNPFYLNHWGNSGMTIRYLIPHGALSSDAASTVLLQIYDLKGNLITTLVNENIYVADNEKAYVSRPWDGKDRNGALVAEGVYVYRLSVLQQVIAKQFMVYR